MILKRYNLSDSTLTFSKLIVYLILITVPLAYSKFFKFSFQIPKLLILELFTILLFLIVFISIIYNNKFIFYINILDSSILFRFILIFLLSFFSIKSDNYYFAFSVLLYLTIFYFLLQIILSFDINYIFRVLLNISNLFLLVSIFEIYLITSHLDLASISLHNLFFSKKILVRGTFGNPNWISGYFAAIFPFLFLLVIINKNNLYRFFYLIGITVIFLFIIVLKSRGAWIALFFGLIFYFFPNIMLYIKKAKYKKIYTFVLLIIILLVVDGFVKIYKMNETSAEGRIFAWKVASLMISSRPITGIGYGNFFYKYLDYQELFFKETGNEKYYYHADILRQCHNEYLQIFAETGILGLSIFLVIIFLNFYKGIKLLKQTTNLENKILRIILTSLLIILFHSFVDTILHNVIPIFLLFFLNMSIISHLWTLHVKKYTKSRFIKSFFLYNAVIKFNYSFYLTKKTKLILSSSAIFVTLFFLSATLQKAKAYYFWQKGINLVKQEKWDDAIKNYNKVLKILPHMGEIKFNLGAAYLNSGKTTKATDYIQKSLNSFSDKNAYISLGFAYMNLGNYEKAEKIFKKLSKKLPNLLLPHLLLAKLYYNIQKDTLCELEIKKVLKMRPKFYNNYSNTIINEARKLKESLRH